MQQCPYKDVIVPGPYSRERPPEHFAREVAIWLAALDFPPPFRINRAQFPARVENSILASVVKRKISNPLPRDSERHLNSNFSLRPYDSPICIKRDEFHFITYLRVALFLRGEYRFVYFQV